MRYLKLKPRKGQDRFVTEAPADAVSFNYDVDGAVLCVRADGESFEYIVDGSGSDVRILEMDTRSPDEFFLQAACRGCFREYDVDSDPDARRLADEITRLKNELAESRKTVSKYKDVLSGVAGLVGDFPPASKDVQSQSDRIWNNIDTITVRSDSNWDYTLARDRKDDMSSGLISVGT